MEGGRRYLLCCKGNKRLIFNYWKFPSLSTLFKMTALLLPEILIFRSCITCPHCVELENNVCITHVCMYRKGSQVEGKWQLFPYGYIRRKDNHAHHRHGRPISHGNMTPPTWKAVLAGAISELWDKCKWARTSVLCCFYCYHLLGLWLLSPVAFLLYNCTILILSMRKI